MAHHKGKLPFPIPNKIGANYKVKVNETHSLLLQLLIVPAELCSVQQYKTGVVLSGSQLGERAFFFKDTYAVILMLSFTLIH